MRGANVHSIDHVEVFVPDRYEAAAWYEGALGLEVVAELEDWTAGGGPLMVSADGGGTMLALFEGEPRGARKTAGHHRVAFRVDGPSFLRFVKGTGRSPVYDDEGRETASGRLMDHGKAYSVYFCDPWGNRYELTTYDRDEVKTRLPALDDPVVVVPYDAAWPSLFEEERARIERAIGPWVEEIEHVGSTAVPGLAAKPVIDIMVGVGSLEDSPALVGCLDAMGYEYVPELERQMPSRRYLRKMHEGRRTHQVHLVERSDAVFWDRHLVFRDYLRAHPEVAEEYARLKRGLSGRFRDDRAAYTEAKSAFIREVVLRAEEREQG
jgi:GrpB-like predicted nucleotidyltransferase (UPF0157 family)